MSAMHETGAAGASREPRTGALRALVLCADDYALHDAASAAIVALARRGRISATSAMTLSPRWAQDVAMLRELRGRIDVGLHLDWTSDFAREAGHGAPLGALMLRSLARGFSAPAVRTVIERQLDAFEAHWQAAPDHVDGHQHVQQFAGIREVLQEVLQRRYGAQAQRPWLRISRVAQPGLKAWVIGAMGAGALQGWAERQGWPHEAPLLGAYGFDGGRDAYAHRMRQWLAAQPARALMMCHPATAARDDDAIGAARVWEYDYLQSEAFLQDLLGAGVRLTRGATEGTVP